MYDKKVESIYGNTKKKRMHVLGMHKLVILPPSKEENILIIIFIVRRKLQDPRHRDPRFRLH